MDLLILTSVCTKATVSDNILLHNVDWKYASVQLKSNNTKGTLLNIYQNLSLKNTWNKTPLWLAFGVHGFKAPPPPHPPPPVNDSSYIQVINEQFNTSMLDKAKKMATFKSVIYIVHVLTELQMNGVRGH